MRRKAEGAACDCADMRVLQQGGGKFRIGRKARAQQAPLGS
jgi:hypothetical protein